MSIPKLLVFPASIQGTVARADLDVANTYFRARSGVLSDAFVQVYLYVMGFAVNSDPLLFDKPGNWQETDVVPPRAVNVDIGRTSSALIAELDAGVRTYQMVYGELGLDYRRMLRQRAKEAAFIKALAAEYKVQPDDIAERIAISLGKSSGGGANGNDAPSSLSDKGMTLLLTQ